MLEQIAYGSPQVSEERQRVYQVGDLESLSAVGLYSDSKNIVKKDGTIETVLQKFVGKDTVKVYIDPFNFSGIAGYQREGESHEEYARRMKAGGGISLGGGISTPSSGNGY